MDKEELIKMEYKLKEGSNRFSFEVKEKECNLKTYSPKRSSLDWDIFGDSEDECSDKDDSDNCFIESSICLSPQKDTVPTGDLIDFSSTGSFILLNDACQNNSEPVLKSEKIDEKSSSDSEVLSSNSFSKCSLLKQNPQETVAETKDPDPELIESDKKTPEKNVVPTGHLIDISPIISFTSPQDTLQNDAEPVFETVTETPAKAEVELLNTDSNESDEDDLPLSVLFGTLKITSKSEVMPTPSKGDLSPQPPSTSSRKQRTVKKRDPLDHPALRKSARGRRRSPVETPAINQRTKKKLFSENHENFIDLNDSSPSANKHHYDRISVLSRYNKNYLISFE